MRARLAIAYCGCSVQLREVVLRDKPSDMLMASPKGTVPVLQLSNATVVDESLDIMHWALSESSTDLLVSEPHVQQALIAECDGDFKPLLDRYKYFQRYPEQSQAFYRDAALDILSVWDKRLQLHAQLMGEDVQLADLAIFPFVRQFAHVDKAWFFTTELVHLQRWLQAWLDSPLFLSIMKKYAPWQSINKPADKGVDGSDGDSVDGDAEKREAVVTIFPDRHGEWILCA